jgi:hypothetical protein
MKSQLPKAIWASSHNFSLELRSVKNELLSVSDLSARANERLPEIRLNAASKQNLDARTEVFPARKTVLANRFGPSSQAMSKESGGYDARIVYDDQFVASQV